MFFIEDSKNKNDGNRKTITAVFSNSGNGEKYAYNPRKIGYEKTYLSHKPYARTLNKANVELHAQHRQRRHQLGSNNCS